VTYDPFVAGPFTVGMRASEAIDASRGGRVLPYEVFADGGGDFAQAAIARLVPVAVVVSLEVIDIDQHHRHRQARGLRL